MANIVIADDSTVVRIKLKQLLTQNNYNVVAEATNGIEAVEAYNQFKPDLITLDIEMPGIDGIAALKKILVINPDAKVIMVTAADKKDKIIEAVNSGAKNYIVKPFEINKMLNVIEKVLAEKVKECEYISICNLFKKSKTASVDVIYSQKYCLGTGYKKCEIRKIRIEGKEVPFSLLPDGTSL